MSGYDGITISFSEDIARDPDAPLRRLLGHFFSWHWNATVTFTNAAGETETADVACLELGDDPDHDADGPIARFGVLPGDGDMYVLASLEHFTVPFHRIEGLHFC